MKQLNYDIEPDENLIRFAREGNRQAFEEIYDRYFSRLELFFKRALWNDAELAKDMTQELFMASTEAIPKVLASNGFQFQDTDLLKTMEAIV